MMKVRMAVSLSGTRDGADWPAIGETIDLPNDEAVGYLNAGICVPVEDDAVEAAVDPAPEKAEKAAGRKA